MQLQWSTVALNPKILKPQTLFRRSSKIWEVRERLASAEWLEGTKRRVFVSFFFFGGGGGERVKVRVISRATI